MATAIPVDEFPHTRIMLAEAAENLDRAWALYAGFNDRPTARATELKLSQARWDLGRQEEAYAKLRAALGLMKERTEDKTTRYLQLPLFLSPYRSPIVPLLFPSEVRRFVEGSRTKTALSAAAAALRLAGTTRARATGRCCSSCASRTRSPTSRVPSSSWPRLATPRPAPAPCPPAHARLAGDDHAFRDKNMYE